MKQFLAGLALILTATISFIPFTIWGMIETIIGLFYKRRFFDSLSIFGNILLSYANIIDRFLNVICKVPFNRILITQYGKRFGSRHETISAVLGTNKIDGNLTKWGEGLCKFLDLLDKDHCIKSIR